MDSSATEPGVHTTNVTDVPRPLQEAFSKEEIIYLKKWLERFNNYCSNQLAKGSKGDWVMKNVYPDFIEQFKCARPGGPNLETLKKKMKKWFTNHGGRGQNDGVQTTSSTASKPRAITAIGLFAKEEQEAIRDKANEDRKNAGSGTEHNLAYHSEAKKEMWDALTEEERANFEQRAEALNEEYKLPPDPSLVFERQSSFVHTVTQSLQPLCGHGWKGHGEVILFVQGAYRDKNDIIKTFTNTVSSDHRLGSFSSDYEKYKEFRNAFKAFAENHLPEYSNSFPIPWTALASKDRSNTGLIPHKVIDTLETLDPSTMKLVEVLRLYECIYSGQEKGELAIQFFSGNRKEDMDIDEIPDGLLGTAPNPSPMTDITPSVPSTSSTTPMDFSPLIPIAISSSSASKELTPPIPNTSSALKASTPAISISIPSTSSSTSMNLTPPIPNTSSAHKDSAPAIPSTSLSASMDSTPPIPNTSSAPKDSAPPIDISTPSTSSTPPIPTLMTSSTLSPSTDSPSLSAPEPISTTKNVIKIPGRNAKNPLPASQTINPTAKRGRKKKNDSSQTPQDLIEPRRAGRKRKAPQEIMPLAPAPKKPYIPVGQRLEWAPPDKRRGQLSHHSGQKSGLAQLIVCGPRPHIIETIRTSLHMKEDDTSIIKMSTNRPNLVYAVRPMIGTVRNFQNLDFLIPHPYHPPMDFLFKTIIFIDNKLLTAEIASYLNNLLPPAHAAMKPVRHYHSNMSNEYLKQTFESFRDPEGVVRILVATSCASNGVDVRDCRIIVLFGAPENMMETDQRSGRGGRDGNTECLVLMIAEQWAYDVQSNGITRKKLAKEVRTTQDVFDYVRTNLCRRLFISHFNDDQTENDKHLRRNPEVQPKKSRNRYRSTAEREALELHLKIWRKIEHSDNLTACKFPIGYLLEDSSVELLAKTLSSTFKSPADITELLQETPSWHNLWADGVFAVITRFDAQLQAQQRMAIQSDTEPESEDPLSEADDKVFSSGLISRLQACGLRNEDNSRKYCYGSTTVSPDFAGCLAPIASNIFSIFQ
ncbi:hypothetical protein H0H93_016411 [Arthromyces matolae]|nr:hypothetical protein H0H93_016411 [Arthromyces matolae]